MSIASARYFYTLYLITAFLYKKIVRWNEPTFMKYIQYASTYDMKIIIRFASNTTQIDKNNEIILVSFFQEKRKVDGKIDVFDETLSCRT